MIALAALVVFAAYTVFGLTGFGSTVIALPFLAQLLALKFAVPLLMLLIQVAERKLLVALGVFLLLYAGYGLARRGAPVPLSRFWCAPIGLAGGALSSLFGTGGVLFAIYNAGRVRDKDALRATNAAMITISSLVRVLLFGAAGLLAQDGLFVAALILLPALVGGAWLGNRLHAAVPAMAVVKAVYAVLVIAGLLILARSLPTL